MRALIIDPILRVIREEEISSGLEPLQKIVGGYIEAIYPDRWDPDFEGHHLYLNEMGRLIPAIAQHRWVLAGWPEGWLCGPAVLLRDGPGGREASARLTVSQLQAKVTFL
jgi:hypothetical protein